MTVSVRFSLESDASPTFLPYGAGTLAPNGSSGVIDLYITHTGTAKIENCRIYVLPYSAGVYLGSRNAQDDYDKLIGYGDDFYNEVVASGGLMINLDCDGGFPSGSWQVFRTGVGDSLANAIDLLEETISIGSGEDGEIPAGGEAHIRFRLDVPSTETDTGRFYIDTLLAYDSTS